MDYYRKNNQANEPISKFKLLSAYGGPGSIVHTEYGSIMISCIEEWGFLKKVEEWIIDEDNGKDNHLRNQLDSYDISISKDLRLLNYLKENKNLTELRNLVLIPNIEVGDFKNTIKNDRSELAINSTFMPKIFSDPNHNFKHYSEWYNDWKKTNKDDEFGTNFFPPKFKYPGKDGKRPFINTLIQDNIVLICEQGHISDFPWSKYLAFRSKGNFSKNSKGVDILDHQDCCNSPKIRITSNQQSSSGFDAKWLSCKNCGKRTSLKGLMGWNIKCKGHKPWETSTGEMKYYSGNRRKDQDPPYEKCSETMKVVLTTGNNLYFSRIHSSIFIPDELLSSDVQREINKLEKEKQEFIKTNDFIGAQKNQNLIEELKDSLEEPEELNEEEKELNYRYQEFLVFSNKKEDEINSLKDDIKIHDVTSNLKDTVLEKYFSRIVRIDNMKITQVQLDFSRFMPLDADATRIKPKNIFRRKPNEVRAYPVVENYGEGIFFSFDEELINNFNAFSEIYRQRLDEKLNSSSSFSQGAINRAKIDGWQLYLVHTFAHLIMRELEFRSGYPTASLSERIYVSNNKKYKMYGCLIYTAEGAEGSMGGLIAQTRKENLKLLLKSAIIRAQICNSDPLCWESEGQGLFELNFASCFSCSLVSETSCELRNLYLDRKLLVDDKRGFFKDILN